MRWSDLFPIVLPVIGMIAAPGIAYLVARRKSSGRVDTTEASTLWDEASKMRQTYQEEAAECKKEQATLRAEIVFLRGEVAALRTETAALREAGVLMRQQLAHQDDQIRERRL